MKTGWVGIFWIMGAVRAQTLPPDPPAVEPVRTVVTVTARPTTVEASAADVTVINLADYPAAHAESVADILRFQPSLYIGQTGNRGGLTVVSLRGGDPNFTLLLMDGVPVNDITDQLGGTVDVGSLLPVNADRVEIVRGPMSATYGSEPLSGVINIITAEEPAARWGVRVAGGSFGEFEGAIHFGGRIRRFSYNLGLAGLRIGEQVERDSFDATDGAARAAYHASRNTSIAAQFRGHRFASTGFPAGSGGPLYALNRALESRQGNSWLAGISAKRITEAWSETLEVDSWRQTQDQRTPTIFDRVPPSFNTIPATIADTVFRRSRINGSSSWRPAGGWNFTVGGSYRHEDGINRGSLAGFGPADYQLNRNTVAWFAEAVLERSRWSVIAAARSDWTDGQRRWSPRAGGSAALWRGARVRTSWGRAFRMPSFYALAQPFFGNPALRPETSESEDLGLEQRLGRLAGTLSASVFHATYRDLVDFSPELFHLVNRSEAIARGVDISWRAKLPRGALLQAHGSYSAAFLKGSSEALRDRPRWRAGAVVSAPAGERTSVQAEALWIASRFDYQVPAPQLNVAGSYLVANASIDRRINWQMSGFVRVENIFNRKYQEYVGFPNPGIQARAGFTYRPGKSPRP